MSRTSRRFGHPHLLDDRAIGLEARAEHDDHLSLKLWLRLLACSTQVENEVRQRLRARFDISLARFDYLAQLHRHADGLRMSTLSRYLMVTGGNVTALTDELEREGMVQRDSDPEDRRSWLLRMTGTGRKAFEGETVSDLLAKILEREPDLSLLPAATPARVRALLRRCLLKDPRERLRDIGEARIALAAGAETEAVAAAPAGHRGVPWWVAASGTLVLAAVAVLATLRRVLEKGDA